MHMTEIRVAISDAHNHNSMIEGIRQAHCEKQISAQ